MSLEAFLDEFPPSPKLRLDMEVSAILSNNAQAKSPLGTFIHELVQAGQQGFISLNLGIENPDEYDFLHLLNQEHLAGIFLGGSILAIEGALTTEALDLDTISNQVNMALRGTAMPLIPLRLNKAVFAINEGQWKSMLQTVKIDPTFTIFFEEPERMPDALRGYLSQQSIYGDSALDCIRLHVLPEYKKRARLLVNLPA